MQRFHNLKASAKGGKWSSLILRPIYVAIGCVTGDAGYFLLTEAEREANKLPIG